MNSLGTFTNQIKTWTLLAALGGLLVLFGRLLGGNAGMILALGLALAINFGAYWFSDSIALKANGARPLAEGELPWLRRIVADLALRARIPQPALYVIDRPEPNAFATGRTPSHSAVAVTTGLIEAMDERQVRGVLAHELSHIVNRDTLVGTVAATFAAAISWLAQMAQFSLFFGGGNDEENGGGNILGLVAMLFLAPIAALIIQLAVSRGREYLADQSGARLTADPEGLASALERLEGINHGLRERMGLMRRMGRRQPQPVPAATAHLYTVSPLSGGGFTSWFSTHPPVDERVRRLRSFR